MLTEDVRTFAKAGNFAALTTLREDGQPATHVMWVDCDEECVLINTEEHRHKASDVQGDPRVTVMIWDKQNPYRYVEVRGRVIERVEGQPARDHIDELSQRYRGRLYDPERITSARIILRIEPLYQRSRGI